MYRYRLFLRRFRRPLSIVAATVAVMLIGVAVIWFLNHRPAKVTDFNSCILAGYNPSNGDPQTCSDGHHTYVAASSSTSSTGPAEPAETAQSYSVLVQGDTEGDYPARQQVVATQAAWTSLWGQLYAKLNPGPPLLPVDFSQDEVVVLTDGPKPSGGYSLEVTGVATSTAGTTVDYQAFSPQGRCTQNLTPTDPVVAIVTAKTNGPVTYAVTPQSRKC